MKCSNRVVSILALSVMPVTAGLAAQPTPIQGTKGSSDTHHAQKGSKTGVDAQKKTETYRGASHQTWRSINTARTKEGVEARQGKVPDPGAGGAKNTPVTPGMITNSARPHSAAPIVGAVGTRNPAGIGGTDLHLKGTTPAIIHPAAKYGARISGTGLAGKN